MAQYKALDTLIQKVVVRLSQVPGVGVQTYAEDRIADMIQHKFDILFDEAFWYQFMHWQDITLDGVTGQPTVNLEAQTNQLERFEDIRIAKVLGKRRTLKLAPHDLDISMVTGTSARYIEPFDDGTGKIFRVWPATTTDTISIHFRSKPDDFVPADTIKFDPQALILGATYDYLEDDGTNPGATEKFKNMFEARVRQLKLLRVQMPLELDDRTTDTLDEWTEL